MDDKQGCTVSTSWRSISTSRSLGINNPILKNGTTPAFAFWATACAFNDITTSSGLSNALIRSCGGFRHFIVPGPIGPDPATLRSDQPSSGWSFLVCEAQWYIGNGIEWSVKAKSKGSADIPDVVLGRGANLSEDTTTTLNTIMRSNFVASDLVYALPEPRFSRAFWGAEVNNPSTMVLSSLT